MLFHTVTQKEKSMYKQPENTLVTKKEDASVLKDVIAQQLLSAYTAGVQAMKGKERELADILSYHIFDLLDWVRQNQLDIQANLTYAAAQFSTVPKNSAFLNALPSNIQELETLVDEKFCSSPCPPEVAADAQELPGRGALC